MTAGYKIERKVLVVASNVVLLLSVFLVQQSVYDDMLATDTVEIEFGEVELAGHLMFQYGEDMNVLVIVCVLLLFVNMIVCKYWVKSKRWIIEPALLFFVSFMTAIGFHVNRGKMVGKEIKQLSATTVKNHAVRYATETVN